MRVLYSLDAPTRLGPAAVTISVFDGVHRGHLHLLERAVEVAQRHGATRVALTCWPHPYAEAPESAEARLEGVGSILSTLDEKLEALAATGLLDATLVLPWTAERTALPMEALLDTLRAWCAPVALVANVDAAIGQEDDIWLPLLAAFERQGMPIERVALREGDEPVSDERIWRLVRAGDVEAVAQLLGRPYALTGVVVPGDRRGRLLGFPTANLRIDERKVLPANGVYAVRVRLPGEARSVHAGVANIGVRPTFSGERKLLVEVHLLDAAIDLYGLTLRVELVARLREERRFDGVEALKAQIGLDAQAARELLASDAHGSKSGTDAAPEDRSDAPWA
jgi:riboflavin kinase/FMN adenylyltransferase